jgi:hypothetical protein
VSVAIIPLACIACRMEVITSVIVSNWLPFSYI